MAARADWNDEVERAGTLPHLPQEFQTLMEHLTDHGRERFTAQLAEALVGPDPLAAGMRVWNSWWYTLVVRQHPGYHEAMSRPPPTRETAVYQTTEQLKAELGL